MNLNFDIIWSQDDVFDLKIIMTSHDLFFIILGDTEKEGMHSICNGITFEH